MWNPALDSPVCLDQRGPSRLEADALQATIRSNYGRLRECYDAGLRRNPTLGGLLSLQLILDAQGRVTKLSAAENELADCEVVTCIKDAVRTIAFPPFGRTIKIVYPLRLAPG